jgi:hypothetical protein
MMSRADMSQIGLGIKGTIARKVMKQCLDIQSEPEGNNLLEVVAFVDKKTEECEAHARISLVGYRLGNMVIEDPEFTEVLFS